ncbi:MAG: Holliday junction resolvase RuvX [Dehalococcoidia bacterium]|nr:Holliday junction resolvase RuvX [Dehalococcoidia bacterium]|tara:strand:- start:123 stop:554 length:432 start_codon:yes stop_codon:yes gene_type:complete
MADQPKLIALDLGERRIGLAVSGPGRMVLPAGHIIRSRLAQDVQQVIAAATERNADGIVVGIPHNPQGQTDAAAKLARGFIGALRKEIGDDYPLSIYEMDERFTSVEAEGLLRESGVEPSRDRASVDETAAVLILQRYLAAQA